MGITSIIKGSVSKQLDTARLQMKINGYSKELSDKYVTLGELYYEKARHGIMPDAVRLKDTLEEIDAIKERLKHLNKNITEKKQGVKPEPAVIKEHNYAKLNRKQGDLTIKRTKEGIKILRKCPACGEENLSNAAVCLECGSEMLKEQ